MNWSRLWRGPLGWHHMATDWGAPWGWPPDDGPADPCPQPSIAEFRARFPEFTDCSDAQIQTALDDASCWVDSSWSNTRCQDCSIAMAMLAAHYLALGLLAQEAMPDTMPGDGTEGGGAVVLPGGQVTSLSFESMSVSFAKPQISQGRGASAPGTFGDQYGLGSTPYGQRFLSLLKVNKPAVAVV